jgi:hypothetical protein
LANDLAGVPQVRYVFIKSVDNATLVWVAVDDHRREVRERIFERELSIMDAFPEINFDFNLVPAMGRTAAEIASDAELVYSRPAKG